MSARGLRKCHICGQKKAVKMMCLSFGNWICRSTHACDPSWYRFSDWLAR